MTLFYLIQIHEKRKSGYFLSKDQKLCKCLEQLARPDTSNQSATYEKSIWIRENDHFIFLLQKPVIVVNEHVYQDMLWNAMN